MFPMTVTIASRAELQAVMAALADTNAYAQAKAIHAEPKAAPAPATQDADLKVAAPKPVAAAPTATPPVKSAAAAPTAASPSEKTPDVATVTAAIIGLAKAKGRDAAVAVLSKFGAAKVPELKVEQYAAVLAAANEANVKEAA